jgi:hypothetical protein
MRGATLEVCLPNQRRTHVTEASNSFESSQGLKEQSDEPFRSQAVAAAAAASSSPSSIPPKSVDEHQFNAGAHHL